MALLKMILVLTGTSPAPAKQQEHRHVVKTTTVSPLLCMLDW